MKKRTGIILALILALAVLMSVTAVAFAAEGEGKLPEVTDSLDEYIDTVPTPDTEHLGDVNDDGKVDIKDATLIQKHIIRIAPIDSALVNRADVDGDGYIRSADVTQLQKKIVGLV